MTKEEARILAKNHRDNIDSGLQIIKSKTIVQKIKNNKHYQNARLIGVYYPFGSEVDIKGLTHQYAKFAYPRIKNGKMDFILVTDKTKWQKSHFGIMEPRKGKIVNSEIDLLLISSLARNKDNYRLGYGKGFYDSFIKMYHPKHTIGIVFDNYTLDFIENLWDIPLDEYISN
ncbi:MAG: 5-formyltetrahydrofolate cyclo-ligase [Acholeplasma sp.]|nr:5-formyltetrahydrofolate cyclo-ligase [Acholeplasma sp.]